MGSSLQNVSTIFITKDAEEDHFEMPTVIMFNDGISVGKDIATELKQSESYTQGDDVITEVNVYDLNIDLMVDVLLEYNLSLTRESVYTIIDEFNLKSTKEITLDTMVAFLLQVQNAAENDINVDLFFNSYIQHVTDNTEVDFRITIGNIPYKFDVPVSINFSAVKYFSLSADVYCSTATTPKTLITDLVQGSGRLIKIDSDIYATISGGKNFNVDIYSTVEKVSEGLPVELITTSGGFAYMWDDIYSTALGISPALSVDLKTRSLYIGEFFIDQEHFTTASSVVWVDVIDYLYPIDEAKTYLAVNGTTVSGFYFLPIDNGVRIYYDPTDDFYNTGVFTYSVHAESSCGEIADQDFNLLFGYDIQLDEIAQWDAGSVIPVRAVAKNLAFCPHIEAVSFQFETVDLEAINLPCYLNAIQYVELPATIYPQSTAFFYGKTYKVTVRNVKDYHGNVMPDFEYEFTIENPRRRS